MAVTVNDIIAQGLRMARVVPLRGNPTAAEAAMGLDVFQGMLDQWASLGVFGSLKDVYKTADYAPEDVGERIHITSGAVTLPSIVKRDGDDFPPLDLSLIEVVDAGAATFARWLFDALKGDWVRVDALALTDDAPLASRGKMGLAACLAVHYCETFGQPITPMVKRQADVFIAGIGAAYVSERPFVGAEYY